MLIEGIAGPQSVNKGAQSKLSLGPGSEGLFSEMGGKYAFQTLIGQGFIFSTTSAASVTALGNNLPSLFNPIGSNVLTVITKVTFQAAAIGTPVISGFQYGFLANAGSSIGTASPIATGTLVAGVNLNINSKNLPKTLFFPAAVTFTTAPALLAPVGLNLGATATQTPWQGYDDVDGRIILAPGSVLQVAASTATSTTFNVAFWAYEVPVPQGY